MSSKEEPELQFKHVFSKAQNTAGCHQKCVVMLTEIYKKTSFEKFMEIFMKYVCHIVHSNADNAPYTERLLKFVSLFCADITKTQVRETENHDFLTHVVEKILEWSCLKHSYDLRYNCCLFLSQILQDLGEEVDLEIRLIHAIQMSLLERMEETKVSIRMVAMSGLVRLQEPHNFECPVIQAYLQACTSVNAQIRQEAVLRVAPNVTTLNTIKERIRDVDPGVRAVAFHKVADIGPLNFRIADKHVILLCGFKETNEKVKGKFFDYLLPKWLTAYQGNYLQFVNALQLLGLEEDLKRVIGLSRQLIQYFYDKNPVEDLLAVLELNDEKLLEIEKITNGLTLFWNILVSILRTADADEQMGQILPELTLFCNFIDKFVKKKSTEQMDEWKSMEYQFDLSNLLEIAESYDYSDEVGRRTMYTLAMSLLEKKFSFNIYKQLAYLANKCNSNINSFTNDICLIIDDIKEPEVVQPLPEGKQLDRDFKLAELRVKIIRCEDSQNDAIAARDFQKSQALSEEISVLKKQLENLTNGFDMEKVRVAHTDADTVCHCLDVLASVLELSTVDKLTPALITVKDEFLVPLISTENMEIHWRVLKCLALISLIDKETAEEYVKVLCFPIVTYRAVPTANVCALGQAIFGITDLIILYGPGILTDEESMKEFDNTKRRLYSVNNEDDSRMDNMSLSSILDIFIEMLDDERQEIWSKAAKTLATLIKGGFSLTSAFLSRILLKWFNPAIDKRLQVNLGLLIQLYYTNNKNAGDVVKDAVIPTLTNLTRAPKISPLLNIDVDNVLLFFSEVMNICLEKNARIHFATDICMKIAEKPGDRIAILLVKLLYRLDLESTNDAELINAAETMLGRFSDRMTIRSIERFISKLKQLRNSNVLIAPTEPNNKVVLSDEIEDNSESNVETNDSKENISEASTHLKETKSEEGSATRQQQKRSKHRNGKDRVRVLDRTNETTLHTIIETSMELEQLSVTCTSESGKTTTSRQSDIISATPESSDAVSESSAVLGRVDVNSLKGQVRCREQQDCVVIIEKLDSVRSQNNTGSEAVATKENKNGQRKRKKELKHIESNSKVSTNSEQSETSDSGADHDVKPRRSTRKKHKAVLKKK